MKGIEGDKFELLFKIDLFTGMRRGEILGLKWDCVDFDKGTITISTQLQTHKGEYFFSSTKNRRSRTIVPASRVMEYLKEQRRKQAADHLLAGELWEDTGLVFTNEAGGYLPFTTVRRHFKQIAKKIGSPDARFHDIRHTYAVNSIRAGVDIKTISENMGHATVAFTLDVYGHVTDEMRRDSGTKMEDFAKNVLGL
ncbi:MAG: site-specific integrase [Oscillibacter sp.]|nr:site-specific integrase [Oscillibacter sp.]